MNGPLKLLLPKILTTFTIKSGLDIMKKMLRYALIKMISKEKEIADSEDERSSEASVTKNPYYPYNQEWFGHDEEETHDSAED